jgi:hypothetical protein
MENKDQVVETEVVVDKQTESDTPTTPEYTEQETIALARGWKPKEEWDGDEGDWKPAKVFNEIGELKEKLVGVEKDNKKANKVIQLMKEHHLNVRQSAFKEALEVLKQERVKALEDQDFAKAEKIRDEIDDVKTKFRTDDVLPRKVEEQLQQDAPEPDPAFYEFVSRNPWYKPEGGNEMSKKADALGWALKEANPNMSFPEIIKAVEKDIRKLFPEKFEAPRQAVNEAGTRAGGESSKGKVKLSDDEAAVAKTFGMTPEEYAKERDSYRGR